MSGTQSLLADYVKNGSERAFRDLVNVFGHPAIPADNAQGGRKDEVNVSVNGLPVPTPPSQ